MAGRADERALLDKYTPLVRRIAHALRSMKPLLLDQEDVVQDGMIGLLRAIRSDHEHGGGAKFAAYARASIRGAIIDGYRSAGNTSRRDYDHAKSVVRAAAAGATVAWADGAAAEQVLATAWAPAADVADESALGLALADTYPGPEQRTASNQLLRRAIDILYRTPRRDRNIFIACELDDEPQARVAACHGLSPGRISQIIKQVRREILAALD